jgi:hypothetical protein
MLDEDDGFETGDDDDDDDDGGGSDAKLAGPHRRVGGGGGGGGASASALKEASVTLADAHGTLMIQMHCARGALGVWVGW